MFKNGQIPSGRLVQLDSGHLSSPASAERWYAFRAAVKDRTGVTLRITPGPNAYRSYTDQQQARRDACARGNCLQAATPGTSPHGGTWSHWRWTGGRTVDAMAFDIDNWWAVPWAVFQEEAERVGFQVGTIRADVAGVDEWWHIVDLDPWGPVLAGGQEDDMFTDEDRKLLRELRDRRQSHTGAPINFRSTTGGVSYTMIPGIQITRHENEIAAALTLEFVTGEKYPGEGASQAQREAIGERQINDAEILVMLAKFGFEWASRDIARLPAVGKVLYADWIMDLRAAGSGETVGGMTDAQLAGLADRMVTIQGQRMAGGVKQ